MDMEILRMKARKEVETEYTAQLDERKVAHSKDIEERDRVKWELELAWQEIEALKSEME